MARSTTVCGSDGFMTLEGACATRIIGSPVGPKCLLYRHSTARHGVHRAELIRNSGPPVVASPGRTALRISLSGLVLFSVVPERHLVGDERD